MRGTRTPPGRLPRDPAVYRHYCDARIADLLGELATATGPHAWERRHDLQRRINGYRLVRDVYQEMAQ